MKAAFFSYIINKSTGSIYMYLQAVNLPVHSFSLRKIKMRIKTIIIIISIVTIINNFSLY